MSSNGPGRWIRRLVVTLVLLAVLAVVVDRIALTVAQNQLATRADTQARKYDVHSSDTSVKINGFGFLPQLYNEKFSSVTMTMLKPKFSGVPAESLKVDMHDVHVPRSLVLNQKGTVTVDTTDLQLKLSPRELGRLAVKSTGLEGLQMPVVDGKVHAQATVQGVKIDVPVLPQIQNGKIAVDVSQLSTTLPSVLRNALKNQLAQGITIPPLPFGAQLSGVSVVGGAVVLTATASGLNFNA
ncbi:LmeA family phospholipid-binding protein [Kribbella sp. NPDC054772]